MCVYHVPFLSLEIENLHLLRMKPAVPLHSSLDIISLSKWLSKQIFYFFNLKLVAEQYAVLAKKFAAVPIEKRGFCLLEAIHLIWVWIFLSQSV